MALLAADLRRKVLNEDGTTREFALTDYAVAMRRRLEGRIGGLPPAFVSAAELSPRHHIAMQAALQPYVDNSISKTINVPAQYPFDEFKEIYGQAYDSGLKGCTTFRPNPVTGIGVVSADQGLEAPHCCTLEREAV